MFVSPSRLAGGLDLGQPRAVAHEQEDDVGAVAKPPGRLEELVERVGQAEVARVHRDELVARARAPCEAGWPRAGSGRSRRAGSRPGSSRSARARRPSRRSGRPCRGRARRPCRPGDRRSRSASACSAAKQASRRHPPERQAGVGVEVHAPVDVPRPLAAASRACRPGR